MKEKIMQMVEQKHISSDGKCGTYIVEFITGLNISITQFRELVGELKKENLIEIRTGINGFMLMKKSKS